ncbi:MAG: MBL fold metallo-hydrolase [Methanosarcinales archaeon]|nr:MBL fold metallo-hydrolase [Methanosarcinales archaeon]
MVEQKIKKILGDAHYDGLVELRKTVKIKEDFLEELLTSNVSNKEIFSTETRFFVARKWNSWYPSFFDAIGGCYFFILADKKKISSGKIKYPGVIIIDPGFKFIETIRKYGIGIFDVGIIIVTHFHTDHMAGLIEFLTLIHKSRNKNHKCKIFLNKTSFEFFERFNTDNVEFIELKENNIYRLAKYIKCNDDLEEIYLKPKLVHHQEIGSRNNSLGLLFEIKTGIFNSKIKKTIGILGDTDGNEDYLDEYIYEFKDVDLLALHLGSIKSDNYGSGTKHLYDSGIILLLEKIKQVSLSNKGFNNLKAIILTEFGLELASFNHTIDMINMFRYENEWKLIMYLVNSITELENSKTDENRLYLEYKIDIYSQLFNHFLFKEMYEKTDSRQYYERFREMPPAIGLSMMANNYKPNNFHENLTINIEDYYVNNKVKKFTEFSTSYNYYSPDLLDLFKHIDKDLPAIKKLENVCDSIIENLIKNCDEDQRLILLDKFQIFINNHLLFHSFNAIKNINKYPGIGYLKNYIYISKAITILKTLCENNENVEKIENELKRNNLGVYSCAIVTSLILLDEIELFRRKIEHNEIHEYVPRYKKSQLLKQFVDLICQINDDLNIVIGDITLEIKINEKIEGKYFDEDGYEDWKPIENINFDEDFRSHISYKYND